MTDEGATGSLPRGWNDAQMGLQVNAFGQAAKQAFNIAR
jgi:hypothetical protein